MWRQTISSLPGFLLPNRQSIMSCASAECGIGIVYFRKRRSIICLDWKNFRNLDGKCIKGCQGHAALHRIVVSTYGLRQRYAGCDVIPLFFFSQRRVVGLSVSLGQTLNLSLVKLSKKWALKQQIPKSPYRTYFEPQHPPTETYDRHA